MYFEFETFAGLPIRQAMSQRRRDAPSEGDVGYARDTIACHIKANRAQFLTDAGFESGSLTLGRQVHGSRVSLVTENDRGRGLPPDFDAIPDSDGLITNSTELALGIIVADCVPVLLYDPVQHALGVVHAGWRGTVQKIVANAVDKMADEFGSKPEDLRAGIGPSIGPCCYEVGEEVIDAWMAGCGRPRRVCRRRTRTASTLRSLGREPDDLAASRLACEIGSRPPAHAPGARHRTIFHIGRR